MVRADLLLSLVKNSLCCDKIKTKNIVESIIAEERAKNHSILANRLEILLNSSFNNENFQNKNNGISDQRISNLVYEVTPHYRLDDLILPTEVIQICNELIHEHNRVDLLRSYNLEPRNRILLIGPPGNGKTSLAEAIAESLMLPLFVVRYDGIVGSYLGETANRLRRLIEYASTRKCVLFFDEFETLGKERGDTHETGEIKRVVSSLLMQIDSLPSHVIVIGATNHAELLDRAVWRRFQIRLVLPKPDEKHLADWFKLFEKRIGFSLGYKPEFLAKKLSGINYSEAEEFGQTVFRQYVLMQPISNIKPIVDQNLKLWSARTAIVNQIEGEQDGIRETPNNISKTRKS
ncbi:AAA ATPase central domain protein [Methanolacinia petrolearia DSM 11571]|uniref:AAA ATPase central domain protein n=1 Tax=Methanolacinia petrolearia (strain DSM 11571 / OCM 486 / SEBR 4847) TaxID=679926 RepID=E1RER6_METP4|nr:ATP-binding protein [Methanolacinia petrolearia]ADN35013.1 AAA ATPase central domain protein [Methanolacinia petrolearia DSM 11571]